MNRTESRKDEHVRISIEENVSTNHNYWDDVKLVHNALPEIDKNDINLSTILFGKKLGAPLIIVLDVIWCCQPLVTFGTFPQQFCRVVNIDF